MYLIFRVLIHTPFSGQYQEKYIQNTYSVFVLCIWWKYMYLIHVFIFWTLWECLIKKHKMFVFCNKNKHFAFLDVIFAFGILERSINIMTPLPKLAAPTLLIFAMFSMHFKTEKTVLFFGVDGKIFGKVILNGFGQMSNGSQNDPKVSISDWFDICTSIGHQK